MKLLVCLLLVCSSSALATTLNATLKLERNQQRLHAELRLDRVVNDQLLVWIWKANPNRQPGQPSAHRQSGWPVEPERENGVTVYRFPTPINADGTWLMRSMVGPGQAGFIGYNRFEVNLDQPQPVSVKLENNFSERVPGYVQPIGYATFGIVALMALALVVRVIRRLEQGHVSGTLEANSSNTRSTP